jgi:hypothetical protein
LLSTHTFYQGSFLQCSLRRDIGLRRWCGFPNLHRWSSPPAGVLVSSPSQDKSVDFLHHTSHLVIHERLVTHATTWETSKLTRSTGPQSRSGHPECWRYLQSQLQGLPHLPPGPPPATLAQRPAKGSTFFLLPTSASRGHQLLVVPILARLPQWLEAG